MTKLLTAITVFISSLVTSVSSVLPISLHKTEETPKNNSSVLGINTDPIYFTINTPANFKQNITAPNVLYSITGGQGVTITGNAQTPTVENDGVLSLQGQTGELTLTAGDGIALDGLKIINSGIKSLAAGDGISIDGNKITNTGILSLTAGDGISVTGNKITNTRPVPNYTLTGWTDSGDTVSLTDLSDSVLIDAVSFGNISITNGHSLTPDTDLGSDLGDATHRFDDLMVANIFSNHSQNFSGQSIFSYIPQNSTFAEASVIINPTTSASGGQLLGLALDGYEKATIDKDGDLVIGYSGNTSTPLNDYPLNIYGHSGTSVAHFDTGGNLTMGNTLTTSGALNISGTVNTQNLNVNSGVLSVTDKVGIGTTNPSEMLTVNGGIDASSIYTQSLDNSLVFGNSTDTISLKTNGSATPTIYMYGSGNLNIGTTSTDGYKLDVAGTATISGATTIGSTLNVNGTTTLNSLTAVSAILGNFTTQGNTTIAGKLGIGTTDPTSSLDIATQTNVDALRLTNSGVKVAGMSTGTNNTLAMDISSQNVTNRLQNGTFDTDLLSWTGSQTYSLNDEFSDTAPTTLATATPVTIQSGGVTNPTPVLGAELMANSNMETGNPPSSWITRGQTLAGVADERTDGNGSQSLSVIKVDSNGAGQNSVLAADTWVNVSAWMKVISSSSMNGIQIYQPTTSRTGTLFLNVGTTPSWTYKSATGRFPANYGPSFYIGGVIGSEVRYDDVSYKPLSLFSLFSTVPVNATATSTDYTVQTDATLIAGTQAGLVMNLDSSSNPQNFILAYHNGTNIYLEKVVSGTYTQLISTSAAYIPGATIKVIKNGFNYSLYYNGVQKGTTQVITDAGIVNNTNHGVFSTYATNSFTNFLVQSQMTNPTPVLGSEMVTNGTFINWTADNPDGWTLTVAEDANNYVTQNPSGIAQIVSTGTLIGVSQNVTTTVGNWYQTGFDITSNTDQGVYDNTTSGVNVTRRYSVNTFTQSFRSQTATQTRTIRSWGITNTSIDNVFFKPLTLSSLFSATNASNANVVASTSATLTAGTQAGLVLNLDSVSNPQNFVIAYHDGTNMHLDKSVAGTYTSLINTAATYVAGANITVRKNGTRYTLVYNGTQVGSDQTISDAGIINNTTHGLFSTYASNSFSNFSISTNLDGTLATDGVNTRYVTDIANTLNTNEQLNIGTGNSVTNGVWYPSVTRAAGKILFGSIITTSNLNVASLTFGFDNNQSHTYNDSGSELIRFGDGNSMIYSTGASSSTNQGDFSTNTLYQTAIVLSNTGSYRFIKGGGYTNWSLIGTNINSASVLYPSISRNYTVASGTTDNIRIPSTLWLPTPLAYDTFTATGSATTESTGPDNQSTPQLTWTGGTKSSGTMSITPTTGDEIFTTANAASDPNGNEGNTTNGFTVNGAAECVITSDNISPQTGTYSIKADSATSYGRFYTTIPTSANTWYLTNFWLKNIYQSDWTQFAGLAIAPQYGSNTTWNNYNLSGRATSANTILRYQMFDVGELDNFSAKPLAVSSLFSTVLSTKSDIIADVNITLTKNTQAGLVTNLDSTSNPTNFIIAYHDGTRIYLDKNVGGTYTNLISTSATYVSGATLRVITYHSDANTLKVRVYYNNAMVGTEQTITDASIINNTIHGLFSTYSGNTFDNFTLWPRGSGGEYAQLTPEDLTVTRDTSVKFAGSTASAKLVAGSTYNDFTQTVNVGDTSTYTLTAYAYTNGSAVTSSDLELYYGSNSITTTYTPLGGEGWYRLQGTVTGIASNQPAGVRVKAGKTVYVDNITLSNGVAAPTTMYVFNSGTGKANLNVQGLVDGTLSGIATFAKAGTISDADFTSTASGMLAVDTLNHRLYFRENDAWSYIARTGGFQIPADETGDMKEGDLLLPYVESKMSDGALHGLYQKFSDISQSGTINIPKDADHADVVFNNPFLKSPIINITSHTSLGKGASVSSVSSSGFTISLDLPALTDYTYSWKALLVSEPLVSQSQSALADFMKLLEATPSATPSSTTSHSVLDTESIQINTSLSSTPSSNLQ